MLYQLTFQTKGFWFKEKICACVKVCVCREGGYLNLCVHTNELIVYTWIAAQQVHEMDSMLHRQNKLIIKLREECKRQAVQIDKITKKYRSGQFYFSSGWYLCAQKSPYALHPVSQKFSQCELWNSSSVCLIDDGPLSCFQGRSSSTSSFSASVPHGIDGVMS